VIGPWEINEATRNALEAMMESGKDQYPVSDFVRTRFSRGRAEGRLERRLEAILAVLAARGAPLDDAARARIRSCTDAGRLERWLARAAVASSAPKVFADD